MWWQSCRLGLPKGNSVYCRPLNNGCPQTAKTPLLELAATAMRYICPGAEIQLPMNSRGSGMVIKSRSVVLVFVWI